MTNKENKYKESPSTIAKNGKPILKARCFVLWRYVFIPRVQPIAPPNIANNQRVRSLILY